MENINYVLALKNDTKNTINIIKCTHWGEN